MISKGRGLFLISLGAAYIFFSYKPVKFDLTEDKRFTLDKSSIKIINDIDEDIVCEMYLCGDMSVHFKKFPFSVVVL